MKQARHKWLVCDSNDRKLRVWQPTFNCQKQTSGCLEKGDRQEDEEFLWG